MDFHNVLRNADRMVMLTSPTLVWSQLNSRNRLFLRLLATLISLPCFSGVSFTACKQKEQEQQQPKERTPKKPRLVFTDIQRRTLHAIFKETKRPSKEMQATIAKQLGLEVSTVANFFMNARRRYHKFQGVVCGEDALSHNGDSSQSACSQS